ncbi:MAG: hypothetical protein H0X07_13110 [Gemmatimonadales bacterium]|nr:hypothetical protein [Gemmatimonadales bacterium]
MTLRAGDLRAFALQYPLSQAEDCRTEDEMEERLKETVAAWRSWFEMHQRYNGPWQELVHMSGRVLQGLTFQRTGRGAGTVEGKDRICRGVSPWKSGRLGQLDRCVHRRAERINSPTC